MFVLFGDKGSKIEGFDFGPVVAKSKKKKKRSLAPDVVTRRTNFEQIQWLMSVFWFDFQAICPQNGTAVRKGLRRGIVSASLSWCG